MKLYDAHNHLQDSWLAPHHAEIFVALKRESIVGMVVNGTEEADWAEVGLLASQHQGIVPSFGLHPWYSAARSTSWLETLESLLLNWPQAWIGECGLDRWKKPFDFADQQLVLQQQLALARRLERPVTLHCLEAWGALWEMITHQPPLPRGFLLHAYSGPLEMVEGWVQRGAYFSFSGYFLHERKASKREVFSRIPMERLLIETDAPAMPLPVERCRYSLPPEPEQGNPVNHPANLIEVAQGLAELRNMPLSDLWPLLEANFQRLNTGE